jgi:DDE superfamily endonuclease
MKTQTIPSSVPGRIPNGPLPEDPRSLLACFLAIVADWEAVFPQSRTYLRAVRQALGVLICLGRRTLSRIIWTNGGQHRDWRAEYFLFSRSQWNPAQLFIPIVRRALDWCPGRYIGIAIDDTRLRKTGPRIQQAFFQRDPLSPKFYVNLMFGLRFLQASLLVPLFRRTKVGARALPIAFEEVSVVKRPRRKLPKRKAGKGKVRRGKRTEPLSALEREWKQYRAAQKLHNLSTRFVDLMQRLRSTFDACGAAQKILLLAVDGSFCNRTVFAAVVQGVELIARARKDIKLCFRAGDGSRRFYGVEKFTPEQVRLDPTKPWKTTKVFYGGKRRKVEYKQVSGVLWQGGARKRLLRLLVIRPTRYRKLKSGRWYYRRPAFLLTTVVAGTVRQLLQIYFDRWQIEVNHREEKDTLGVGQAQLWNVTAVPKQPAFAVASYSALLLAALQAFGAERGQAYAALPKWRRRAARPSALDLITLLRKEMTENANMVAHLGLNPTDRAFTAAAAA